MKTWQALTSLNKIVEKKKLLNKRVSKDFRATLVCYKNVYYVCYIKQDNQHIVLTRHFEHFLKFLQAGLIVKSSP